jgi:hypothetical protein
MVMPAMVMVMSMVVMPVMVMPMVMMVMATGGSGGRHHRGEAERSGCDKSKCEFAEHGRFSSVGFDRFQDLAPGAVMELSVSYLFVASTTKAVHGATRNPAMLNRRATGFPERLISAVVVRTRRAGCVIDAPAGPLPIPRGADISAASPIHRCFKDKDPWRLNAPFRSSSRMPPRAI